MDKQIKFSCTKDIRDSNGIYKLEIIFSGIRVELYEGEDANNLYEKMCSYLNNLSNFECEIDIHPDLADLKEGKACILNVTDGMSDPYSSNKANPADTLYSALYLGLAEAIVNGSSDAVKTLNQTLAIVNQSPKIMIDKNNLKQMQIDMRS